MRPAIPAVAATAALLAVTACSSSSQKHAPATHPHSGRSAYLTAAHRDAPAGNTDHDLLRMGRLVCEWPGSDHSLVTAMSALPRRDAADLIHAARKWLCLNS